MACHTLPYSCSLVEAAPHINHQDRADAPVETPQPNGNVDKTSTGMVAPASEEDFNLIDPVPHPSHNPTHPHELPNLNTLEIRQGDFLVQPRALHSPITQTIGSPLRSSTLPKTHVINEDSKSLHSIITDVQQQHSSSQESLHSHTGTKSHANHPRWVLTPRRGHAALNAGIRSLGDRDVTLVAYPGELLDENNEILSESEISEDLKKDLDVGLETLAKNSSKKGIRCKAVWLEDKLSQNFYEGYCKGYLWPIFHYFVCSLSFR